MDQPDPCPSNHAEPEKTSHLTHRGPQATKDPLEDEEEEALATKNKA
jgi:hypothetical protein